MNPIRRVPHALKIVAYLFMIEGFLFFASMVTRTLSGKYILNLGVFAAWVGWGLLKLNPRSYRWAFIFVWFYLVLFAIGGLVSLLSFVSPGRAAWESMLTLVFCGVVFALK